MKILVVEDNAFVAFEIVDILRSAGFDVVGPSASAQHARKLAKNGECDCALVDIDLADGRTGGGLAETLWHDFNVPVVLVTAQTRLARTYRDAAVGCIAKPFREEVVLQSVKQIATQRHGGTPDWPKDLILFE